MATRLEACDDGNFVVHGDLDFHSIADLLEDSDKLFPIKTSSETPSKSPLQYRDIDKFQLLPMFTRLSQPVD